MPDRQLDFGPGSEAPAAKAEFASAVMRRERPASPGRTCLIQILEELHLQILEELHRHCERSEAIHSFFAALWIASRSLSSGAHSRDPLARNDRLCYHSGAVMRRSCA